MSENKKIEIQLATEHDVNSIHNMVKQAFVQYCNAIGLTTIEALNETEEDIIKDMQQKQVYVACCEGKAVGSIRIQTKDKKAFISRFSILPEYQSLGIGSKILSFLDELFCTLNINHVELYSAVENLRLKDFYINNGYKIISIDESRGYHRGLFCKEYKQG